jgi:hypothetical protein
MQNNINNILEVNSSEKQNEIQYGEETLNVKNIQKAGKKLKNIVIIIVTSTVLAILLFLIAYTMKPNSYDIGKHDYVSNANKIKNIYIISGLIVFISNITVLISLYLAGDNLEKSVNK